MIVNKPFPSKGKGWLGFLWKVLYYIITAYIIIQLLIWKFLLSLNKKVQLTEIAKSICRQLRKNPTEAEAILWESLRKKRICGKKFLRQYPFFHDITGRETFFIGDFYCHAEKLIIELDGEYHKYKLNEDEERIKILNHLGLRVIRFKNEEVINNKDHVLSEIKKSLMN